MLQLAIPLRHGRVGFGAVETVPASTTMLEPWRSGR